MWCGVWMCEKVVGIDGQMSNVGGAACTGLFGGGRRPPSNRVYMPSTCKKMSISKS
jgi:hypothetical protein